MKKKLIVIAALALSNFSFAKNINCQVVKVIDGDTIRCLTEDKKLLRIQLYLVDAPEKKQNYGYRSQQYLASLIYQKNVMVETHGKDRYNRILGTVYDTNAPCRLSVDECNLAGITILNINLTMIAEGAAWYYPFAKKNELYKQAEEFANKNKRGLWAYQNPIAPWEFRKNMKTLTKKSYISSD